MDLPEKKPCLIQTRQGFSVLYNQKYLYSKYNPSKPICQIIENLDILPGTIFLCLSPLLEYGMQELISKIETCGGKCLIILCEKNAELFGFMKEHNVSFGNTKKISENCSILVPSPEQLDMLPVMLGQKQINLDNETALNISDYRRIKSISFSAGSSISEDYNVRLEEACVNSLKTFWINRMTLVKFGRRYSSNLFANLKTLVSTTKISSYFKKIDKPIIVCGAGQSLTNGIKDFSSFRNLFFIICVDTALPFLLKNGIIPNAVFVEEAQNIILKAFIGNIKDYQFKIFLSLTATNTLTHQKIDRSRLGFYFSEYSDENFLNELISKDFFPPHNKPFGSVGLTAVHYALKFRKNDSVPVFLYGLDFAYSAGLTHVKEAISSFLRSTNANRINPQENYGAAFSPQSMKVTGKDGKKIYSTANLTGYGESFNFIFSGHKNLFDAADFGVELSLKKQKPLDFLTRQWNSKSNKSVQQDGCESSGSMRVASEQNSGKNAGSMHVALEQNFGKAFGNMPSTSDQTIPPQLPCAFYSQPETEKLIDEYFLQKINQLEQLKSLLTGKDKNIPDSIRTEKIEELCRKNEYLYLHFPDGYDFSSNIDFLKRIRNEIDFFEKIMEQK